MKNPFDLGQQFKHYLEKSELPEKELHPIQLEETRRAFMAGCSQMFILVVKGIGKIESDDEAEAKLNDIFNQLENFWKSQQ